MIEKDSPISVIVHPVSGECENAGLTKREYFAALAMQGLLASHQFGSYSYNELSEVSLNYADTLIEKLNK